MNTRVIRSFIAIELPENVQKELTRLQNILKTGNPSWFRWVSPDSIHLTLKFLGDISSDKIEEITMAVKDASKDISQFSLQIEGLGVFPNLNRIQVVWVGLGGDLNILRELQKQIEINMAILGYPEERREFTPHLTLARVRFQPPPNELQKFTKTFNTTVPGNGKFSVTEINLTESQLTPHGAVYTKLASIALNLP
ncbi:MAG: RNA 2',3'-cyclic phosphodiesterase [Dehalococcoidales bacterium]|nr:RNA 2',3'-cyclic phosphodiesterase [Dehalococcoidales bacterium]